VGGRQRDINRFREAEIEKEREARSKFAYRVFIAGHILFSLHKNVTPTIPER
jgi:hypothetical protein